MATTYPFPTPAPKPNYIHQIAYNGEFYDDELPPELFDPEEDIEELAMFVHIAEHIDE